MTQPERQFGVYVHWPYCDRICPYCDFNVVRDRGRSRTARRLVRAIGADLEAWAVRTGPRQLASIYFGGGTPSLMAPADLACLIDTATTLWPPAADIEITMEANPTDAETSSFAELSAAGVNRLSLGLQSLDDAELAFLGRNHDAATARRALARALETFPRVSFDLIYGLPDQTARAWAKRLEEAAGLGAEHLSAYQLTIEPDTAFGRAARRGELPSIGSDLAADLYQITQAVLAERGFEAYEVSNHARGKLARSRHNLIYWRGGDYLGAGPGAHGRLTLNGERFATLAPAGVGQYVAAVEGGGAGAAPERLTPRQTALERLLMGLRTDEGVETTELDALGVSGPSIERFEGLLRLDGGRLYATAHGRPVLDRLIAELADAA